MKDTCPFDDDHVDSLDRQMILKASASKYVGHETRIDGDAKGGSDGEMFTQRYLRRVPDEHGEETTFDFNDKFYLIDTNPLSERASISRLFSKMSVFYTRD